MRKIGLILSFPEGKKAGYYAQVVKALAENAQIFDRDKELIVLHDAEDRDRALSVLGKYRIPAEEIGLMLLPEGAELLHGAEEYGFQSRSGRVFLYEDRTAAFRFAEREAPGAAAGMPPASSHGAADDEDRRAALLQLEEHIVLRFSAADGHTVYVCEPHMRETVDGVARRYGAFVEFLW